MEYWAENPPVHVILAARYLKKSGRKPRETKGDMMQELRGEMAKFGLGGSSGPLPAIYRDK